MSKPGKWLYIVAGVVIFGGSGASVFHGCSSSTDSIQRMKRASMPGEATVDLAVGRHGVFLESQSGAAGDIEMATQGADMHTVQCTLLGPTDKMVQLQDTGRVEIYNLGGYAGELLWDIQIDRPGPHVLSCQDHPPRRFQIAIGEGFTVGDLMIGIVGAASSIMIGLAIFFFTFIRRRSGRHQALAQAVALPGETPPT